MFMTSLDSTIVSVALPTMASELGEEGHNTQNISWVLLIYTLALCCFVLLWSKIGSNKGYKKVFVTGIAIFTVTSLVIGLCGFIPQLGLGAIIVLRAVQGLGAGMVIAMSLAMVSVYLPKEKRGSSIGAVTLAASVGTAFGPAIGGILTAFHWSYIFFINLPVGIICITLCLKFMHVHEVLPEEKKRLDIVGALLIFLMMFSMILYLNKGKDWGWMSETGILLIFLVALGAGAASWWEKRAEDPLITARVFGDTNIRRSNVVGMLLFMSMAGSYLLLPYYFQFVMGLETMQYGFILIANSLGMMAAGPLVGKITDRTGDNKTFIVIGSLVCAFGFFLMMTFNNGTELWFILIALFVMGAGIGMALVASTNLVYSHAKAGEDGQISGLTNTFRQAGSSAGVAILNAVFMATLIFNSPLDYNLIPGFRHAFFVAVIISLIAFALSMSLVNGRSNGPSETAE